MGAYTVSESDVCPFKDVQVGGYADPFFPDNYIAVCAAKGITKGKDATHFDPSGKITRYQVISMVVRTADDLKPGLLTPPPPPPGRLHPHRRLGSRLHPPGPTPSGPSTTDCSPASTST